jgi:hypothetical protein
MNDQSKIVTGGCLCGAVRYELDHPPYMVGYCHCGMCRKTSGNLFGVAAFVKPEDLKYQGEEPTWYASSAFAKRGFCVRCGSPIAWQQTGKNVLSLWAGSLDDPAAFMPEAHYNVEDKIPWVDIQTNLRDATAEGPSRLDGFYSQD